MLIQQFSKIIPIIPLIDTSSFINYLQNLSRQVTRDIGEINDYPPSNGNQCIIYRDLMIAVKTKENNFIFLDKRVL